MINKRSRNRRGYHEYTSRETGNNGYTRHKMNKAKYTTQYVLDTTTHKTQDTDKQNTDHNTIHLYVFDTTIHKTQDEDKHNKKHNTI